jgi:hypothetical protein
VTLPLYAMLTINLRKAEERGIFQTPTKKQVTLESVWKQSVAFDCKRILCQCSHAPRVSRDGLTSRQYQE